MPKLRVPREIDPDVFIPFDPEIARSKRYLDKVTGLMVPYKHIRAITPRNIAKSYTATVDAIERALRGHVVNDGDHKTLYMRRGVDELETSFATLVKEVQKAREFPDFEFRQRGREWQAKPWDAPSSSWRTIIYGTSLREAYKMRSSVWSDVDSIVFDEFIDDGSNPIEGEAVKWDWVYDTIARNRPVRTLMIANPPMITPGVSNPYFVADGIRVDVEMPEWVRLKSKSTLYWFPKAGQFGNQQETSRQREVGDSEYGLMSNRGQFVNAYGIPVGKRDPLARPLCALLISKKWYSIWIGDSGQWFVERKAPKSDIPRYAASPRDIAPGVSLFSRTVDHVTRAVKQAIISGSLQYEDTALLDEILPLITR